MGIADLHAALYEVKDGTLVALFGKKSRINYNKLVKLYERTK